MGEHDYRSKPNSEISYYIFNDLRFSQNGLEEFEIYRYDDLSKALAKFNHIQPGMTPALGMHLSERSELDLVHRREGEPVLVTDYLNYADWRTNSVVRESAAYLCESLNIQWQMDGKCLPHAIILIPLERGFHRVPDRAFSDKNLLPRKPQFYGNKEDPSTAINEAYVEGEGWINYEDFRKKAEAFGYRDPHCLKVKQFNINYVTDSGRFGEADVSPMDMQILQERYQIRHGDEMTVKRCIDQISEQIAELVVTPGNARDEYMKTIKGELSQGNAASAIEALEAMRDYGDSDQKIALAIKLLARVQSLPVPSNLPDFCYSTLPSTGALIMIKNGEEGYFSTSMNSKDPACNRETAQQLNDLHGVTPAQVKAMEIGSMFGWDSPGARPECYEKTPLKDRIFEAKSRKETSAHDSLGKESEKILCEEAQL